jgi:flagellar basal-body rod modification protein FlgD
MFLDSVTTATAAGSGTQSATDRRQLDENLNQFLSLLVTQLQYQDPLQPMDTNEFTQQLVQFASVEQQIYQNNHLEALLDAQKSLQQVGLTGYLGTDVETDGGGLSLSGGSAHGSYTLPASAADVTLTVADAAGEVVLMRSGERTAGRHAFHWDGRDDQGTLLPDGLYTLSVAARAADGATVPVSLTSVARVTGIAYDAAEPSLLLGERTIPLAAVRAVGLPADKAAADPAS